MPVLLLEVPQLNETVVRERIAALENEEKEVQMIVLLTAAEVVDREARIYLAQRQYPVALITAVELREAIMKGEQDCYQLLANALGRAAERDNPFKYRKLVQERSEFFGREKQKGEFTSLILEHELVGLYGIHKIGKSSLLKQIHQHLAVYAHNITPVWIELSAAIKNPPDLYQKILEGLYGAPGKFQRILLSAAQFQQELLAFQKSKRRDYAGHQILLVLDEYPYLIPGKAKEQGIADYMEVLGLFKVLSQEGWFNFLPCGRTTALSFIPRWPEGENPFIGILQARFLGPWNRDEVEELVKVKGFKAGMDFSSEAIERMWILAGGHPLFTQTLGSCILEKSSGDSRAFRASSVTANMVDDAVEAFLRSGNDRALLRKIYQEELEDEEQRIVKILAAAGRPLPRTALVPDNPSKEDFSRVRMAVNNLLDTSVLKEDGQRHLSHRYELLCRVIVQDMEEASLYGEGVL